MERTEEEEGITRVGLERWLSVHIYDETGTREVLLEVVPAVLQRLHQEGGVDSFFFVRYRDERGPHVRLRLRLLTESAQPCWKQILATAGERFPVLRSPFELEVERYGGNDALPHSLAFFAISSAHALAFEREFGGLPRSRQMTLALCVLLWQAWGFAKSEGELRALLGYYALGQERYPAMVTLAEESFGRSGGKLTELVSSELQRLIALGPMENGLPSLASANSFVTATRALSVAIGDLDPEVRWSVGSSQMHMTANRLGLTNQQETYAAQILARATSAIASSDGALWYQVPGALERPSNTEEEPAAGATALRNLVRSHLAALLQTS
jgi:thiopeptide-type bacteriocin biosynthesis protein